MASEHGPEERLVHDTLAALRREDVELRKCSPVTAAYLRVVNVRLTYIVQVQR